MWASGHNGDIKRAAHGYEATREQAIAAFARSWRREDRGRMGEKTKITHATATLSLVPSEDGKAWQAQFTWDDGRVDRVLRFERKEDAEAWISLNYQ
jgi:hypothetical protein